MTGFASDNTAGAHRDVLAAIVEASAGHAPAYGADAWTERAREALRQTFGPDADGYLVTTGTAANVLALDHVTRPWHAVICGASAHIAVDECGAPERYAGVKLVGLPTEHGKLEPGAVAGALGSLGDEHRVQPRVVSLSQATELGTVYTVAELRALVDEARQHGLLVHVDGARLANASARLGVSPGDLTAALGVDVLSLGLTKTGAVMAEAVVFLTPGLADGFAFARKQGMQLVSKQRFVAAQVIALLDGGLWLGLAAHANAMADLLHERVASVIEIAHPVEANAVFARVPGGVADALREAGLLMAWDGGLTRWMTAWDTTATEVEAFAGRVVATLGFRR